MTTNTTRVFAALFATIAATAACAAPRISKERLDVIALCSAGYSVKISAAFEADVRSIATKGTAKGSVGLEREVKGQFVNDAKVSEQNAVLLYQSYVNCIQSEKSLAELVAILERRRTDLRAELMQFGQSDTLARFDELYSEYIEQTRLNQKVAAHETGRLIYDLLNKAAVTIAEETGQTPGFLFEDPGHTSHDLQKLAAQEQQAAKEKGAVPRCADVAYRSVSEGEFVYRRRPACRDEPTPLDNAIDQCAGAFGPERAQCETGTKPDANFYRQDDRRL